MYCVNMNKTVQNKKPGILVWHDCGILLPHQILYGRNCCGCLNTNDRLKVFVFEDTGQDWASIQMANPSLKSVLIHLK